MAFFFGGGRSRRGSRGEFRFFPGCLVFSLLASIALTILLNVILRLF